MYKITKDDSGVFSNFLRAIDWFWYSYYSGDQICLDWNYKGINLLDDIFEKCHECTSYKYETTSFVEQSGLPLDKSIEKRRNSVSLYNNYKGYFYTSPEVFYEADFKLLRLEMNKGFKHGFKFKQEFINSEENSLVDERGLTLGVHLRNPIHYRMKPTDPYGGGLPISTKKIFDECSEFLVKKMKEGKFERIYIACENQEFIKIMVDLLGTEKVIYHKHLRYDSNIDWFSKPNIFEASNMKSEIKNCFLDSYNLSLCNELVGTTSNVMFGSLIINPQSEFCLFPIFKEIYGC